jgi:hypothetical protein
MCRPFDSGQPTPVELKWEEVMTDYVIQIQDSYTRVFFMTIWTPSTATNLKFWKCDRTRYQNGDWETSDKGFIRFSSGDAFLADPKGAVVPGYCFSGYHASYNSLYLGEPDSISGHDYEAFKWGIVLREYMGGMGVLDSGTGEIKQSWVLALQPGTIWWKKATMEDMFKAGVQRSQQGSP